MSQRSEMSVAPKIEPRAHATRAKSRKAIELVLSSVFRFVLCCIEDATGFVRALQQFLLCNSFWCTNSANPWNCCYVIGRKIRTLFIYKARVCLPAGRISATFTTETVAQQIVCRQATVCVQAGNSLCAPQQFVCRQATVCVQAGNSLCAGRQQFNSSTNV